MQVPTGAVLPSRTRGRTPRLFEGRALCRNVFVLTCSMQARSKRVIKLPARLQESFLDEDVEEETATARRKAKPTEHLQLQDRLPPAPVGSPSRGRRARTSYMCDDDEDEDCHVGLPADRRTRVSDAVYSVVRTLSKLSCTGTPEQ